MRRVLGYLLPLLILLLLPAVWPQDVSAHGIHKPPISSAYTSRMIDDAIFINDSTMSIAAIQNFLNQKVPVCQSDHTCLKDYSQGGKTAARIIYETAQEFGINPRVILVTLQKEQSLVTDDWPTDVQYRTAMGYGCPESQSTCDAEYYGFTNQVRLGTNLLRVGHDRFCGNNTSYPGWSMGASWYVNDTDDKNPYTIDGKSTTILTCATASLYNYTPHRVDSGYLTASDGSHYYGNYNFVTTFQNWFGTTWVSVLWMKSSSNATEYVVYGGRKQPVDSPDTRVAWNIHTLNGGTPEVWSNDRVTATPDHNFGSLSRRVRRVNTNSYYFVDGGNYFSADNPKIRKLWNIPDVPSYIAPGILGLVSNHGRLSPYVSDEASTIYFVDNNILRPITNPQVLHAWYNGEGVSSISSTLTNQMTPATPPPSISHNRISVSTYEYLVSDAKRILIPPELRSQYPYTPLSVSQDTIDFLANGGQIGRFVRSSDTGGVYIVDGGTKHGLPNYQAYSAYSSAADIYSGTFVLEPNAFSLVTEGALWRSALVKNGTNYYALRNGQKQQIPSNQVALFGATSRAHTVSTSLLNALSTGGNTTPFVTSPSSTAVFLLDNGNRRGISSPTRLAQLKPNSSPVTHLSDHDLASYPYINNLTNHLGDGTTQYLVDNGTRHQITDNNIRQDWGLDDGTLSTVSSTTLAYFQNGSILTRDIKIGSVYYVVSNGSYYRTNSTLIANIWGLSSAPSFSAPVLNSLTFRHDLTRFVASDASNTLFTVDGGELIAIGSTNALRNLGYAGENFVTLSGAHTDALYNSKLFHGYFIKKTDNSIVVIDQGKIRSIATDHATDWKGPGFTTDQATAFSNSYLSLLGNDSQLEGSIKWGGSATIYAMISGEKRPITSPQNYRENYAPHSNISSYLLVQIPQGANAP